MKIFDKSTLEYILNRKIEDSYNPNKIKKEFSNINSYLYKIMFELSAVKGKTKTPLNFSKAQIEFNEFDNTKKKLIIKINPMFAIFVSKDELESYIKNTKPILIFMILKGGYRTSKFKNEEYNKYTDVSVIRKTNLNDRYIFGGSFLYELYENEVINIKNILNMAELINGKEVEHIDSGGIHFIILIAIEGYGDKYRDQIFSSENQGILSVWQVTLEYNRNKIKKIPKNFLDQLKKAKENSTKKIKIQNKFEIKIKNKVLNEITFDSIFNLKYIRTSLKIKPEEASWLNLIQNSKDHKNYENLDIYNFNVHLMIIKIESLKNIRDKNFGSAFNNKDLKPYKKEFINILQSFKFKKCYPAVELLTEICNKIHREFPDVKIINKNGEKLEERRFILNLFQDKKFNFSYDLKMLEKLVLSTKLGAFNSRNEIIHKKHNMEWQKLKKRALFLLYFIYNLIIEYEYEKQRLKYLP